jgi:hypothetical protein
VLAAVERQKLEKVLDRFSGHPRRTTHVMDKRRVAEPGGPRQRFCRVRDLEQWITRQSLAPAPSMAPKNRVIYTRDVDYALVIRHVVGS